MASQTTTTTTAVARVNLLPPEIAEARRARQVQAGLAGAVVAAVAVVGLLYLAAVGSVNDAEEQVAASQARAATLAAQRAELQAVVDTYAAVSAREALLRAALAGDIAWSGYLNDLMLMIPDNVWLTSMSASQGAGGLTLPGSAPVYGSVNFSGIAFDHDDVATWLESLARQSGFSNAYFSNSTEGSIGGRVVYNFSSTVTLTDAALSDRVQRLLGS